MAKRTRTLTLFPWEGGVVSSLDEGLLKPGQLTKGDNLVLDYTQAKRRRDGINYNYDNCVFSVAQRSASGTSRTLTGTFTNTGILVGDKITITNASNTAYNAVFAVVTVSNGTTITYTVAGSLTESATAETAARWGNKVVGGIDYWFGTQDSRAQYIITVLDNGAVYRTANGSRNRITDSGRAWTIPSSGLTEANLEVFNNCVVIAVSGVTNQMKFWTGSTDDGVQDLPGVVNVTSVSRASSGTTRTLVLSGNVDVENGETIVVLSSNASYRGTFTLASGSGTSTITYTGTSSLSESTTSDTDIQVGVFAPKALFIRQHQGRLFCNDKENLDRLHYSGADLHTQWNGVGTSGALDIGIGDGDPAGLTGLSPTFKGDVFVGKRTKLYRLIGNDPDTYAVLKLSNGIGFISHQAITAVDNDDVFFVSEKGLHSLVATDQYGDFSAGFLSQDIQKSFVQDWSVARRRHIKAVYLAELNSAAFAVTEGGAQYNNALWLFNIEKKAWFRWPNVQCETLIATQDTDRKRVYFGTQDGRLAQTFTGTNKDVASSGAESSILSRLATGLMFPDGRPDTVKAFKRLMIIYKGQGSYTITARVKIDNFSEQALAFVSNEQSVALGEFVLGQDVLGSSYVIAPYSLPIDGYGRGIKVTIEQNDLNTALSIQGLVIEYEGDGDQPEARTGDDS